MATPGSRREIDVSSRDVTGRFTFGPSWLDGVMRESKKSAKELAHMGSPSAAYVRMLAAGTKSPSLAIVEGLLRDLGWTVVDRQDGLIRATGMNAGDVQEITFTKGTRRQPGKTARSTKTDLLLDRIEALLLKADEIQGALQKAQMLNENLLNWTSRQRLGSAVLGTDERQFQVRGHPIKISLRVAHQRGVGEWRYVKVTALAPESTRDGDRTRWKIWEPAPTHAKGRPHPDHKIDEDIPDEEKLPGWDLIGDPGWETLLAWVAPDRVRDSLATFPPTFWSVFEVGSALEPLRLSHQVIAPSSDPVLSRESLRIIREIVRRLNVSPASRPDDSE